MSGVHFFRLYRNMRACFSIFARNEGVPKDKTAGKPENPAGSIAKYMQLITKMFWQILFFSRSKIDATWTAIAKAVVSGASGTAAKVFESDSGEQKSYYVICVYTEDFTNKEEVWAAEQSLRKLGITEILRYKPNIYTTLGIYSGNEWGIRPTIYQSRACK